MNAVGRPRVRPSAIAGSWYPGEPVALGATVDRYLDGAEPADLQGEVVGLIVPHLMRMLVGSDHRILVPAATLFGGFFLVVSDTVARTVLSPQQLPVGVITALLGVPLFLLLLNRARLKGV